MATSSAASIRPSQLSRWTAVAAFAGTFLGLPAWMLVAEHYLQGHLASDSIVSLQVWPVVAVGLTGFALLAHARLRPIGYGLVSAVMALGFAYALLVIIIFSSPSSGFMS